MTMRTDQYCLRRNLLALLLAAAATPALAVVATPPPLMVFKSPWCGCCSAWVDRMRAAGFARITVTEVDDLAPTRRRLGIPDRYSSCHTGQIQGYALEGHVPPSDVRKLLAQRPVAGGVAVLGMPLGSPGMEAGSRQEAFDTMLIPKNGSARIFTRHPLS
jgi:hypothetical protein